MKLSVILSGVLLVFLLASNWLWMGRNDEVQEELKLQVKLAEYSEKITKAMLVSIKLSVTETEIDLDAVEIISEDDQKENLRKFGNEFVFYKFSKDNCNYCVNRDLSIIEANPTAKVIVLTDYGTKEELWRAKKLQEIKYPLYRLVNWKQNRIDLINFPYFFKLSGSSIIRPWITVQEHEDVTTLYLQESVTQKEVKDLVRN